LTSISSSPRTWIGASGHRRDTRPRLQDPASAIPREHPPTTGRLETSLSFPPTRLVRLVKDPTGAAPRFKRPGLPDLNFRCCNLDPATSILLCSLQRTCVLLKQRTSSRPRTGCRQSRRRASTSQPTSPPRSC